MKKILALFIVGSCLSAGSALADVKYYVGKDGSPDTAADIDGGLKRIYAYGGYGLSIADPVDGAKAERGGGGIIGGVGFRFAETVRVELAYEGMGAEYAASPDPIKFNGSFGFANILFDAKLPADYRLFKTSPFVPFVGFGVGAGYLEFDGGMRLGREFGMAYNFIGGVLIEINRTLALGFSYKYVKMLPDALIITDTGVAALDKFAPSGHLFGATFRMNF